MDEFISILKENTDFSDSIIYKLLEFNELLYEKNEVMNLTRIKKEESAHRNFLDSLNPEAIRALNGANNIIDIGSGSGFPAMAIAIAFPEKRVTMVEATGKKADFLKKASETLGLCNTEVISTRAEELAHDAKYRERFDAVTARAVANMGIISEISAGFAKQGGKLVFYKGAKVKEEIKKAKANFKTLGISDYTVCEYKITGEGDNTFLVTMTKDKKLSSKYPRPYAQIKKSN